ncbi:molybdopterin-binding protein [Catenulispora rubra]|uniref:molybdopterin-binding protein n=1 Tax=Catenulispora rubra TaxID=280293 RepID=UPI001892103A|nr:molybdopterin-binding protein [Catenulispora rubra]
MTAERDTSRALAWAAARERAHAAAVPTPATRVALGAAAGLALAEDLVTAAPMPAFDTAAMDGYAVSGAGPWTVVGAARAGRPWPGGRVEPGCAVGISTGAVVPAGTWAVLPMEAAVLSGTSLVGPDLPRGKHIRHAGEDAPAGAALAPAGTRAGPALLGLAASCGYDELLVRRAPIVRAVVTGDELDRHGRPGPGRVRDALSPLLPSLVQAMGGRLEDVIHVPDHPASALGAAVEALEATTAAGADTDVVVVGGSTSVGVTDGLRRFLTERDAQWIVDTVACRPGRPQVLARLRGGPFVIGLPGNPFAALVAAYTLLEPLISGLSGRRLTALPQAPLLTPIQASTDQTRIIPVMWDGASVRMLGTDRPAFLNGAALADALAAVPPGAEAGQPVPLVVLHQ